MLPFFGHAHLASLISSRIQIAFSPSSPHTAEGAWKIAAATPDVVNSELSPFSGMGALLTHLLIKACLAKDCLSLA